MNLLTRLLGWKEASFIDYQQAYTVFGGSILSNPRILQFIHRRFQLDERYFIKHDRTGRLIGAVCTWDNKYIAGDQRIMHKYGINRYPFNTDEIALPIDLNSQMSLPFRTKFLSPLSQKPLLNSNHLLNAHREISIVKPVSSKTRSSRNRELKRFLNAGGSVHPIAEYDTKTLVQIYADLYFLRRKKRLEIDYSVELINEIPDLLFGSVLAFNEQPCAMQWVVKVEDHNQIYLDYVNAGMNPELAHLSIGTISAWVNIRDSQIYGESKNKKVRFSFGRPTANYKDRWCIRESLYRVIA